MRSQASGLVSELKFPRPPLPAHVEPDADKRGRRCFMVRAQSFVFADTQNPGKRRVKLPFGLAFGKRVRNPKAPKFRACEERCLITIPGPFGRRKVLRDGFEQNGYYEARDHKRNQRINKDESARGPNSCRSNGKSCARRPHITARARRFRGSPRRCRSTNSHARPRSGRVLP